MSGGTAAMTLGGTSAGVPRWVLPAAAGLAILAAALACVYAVGPRLNQPLQTLRVDGALSRLQPQQIAAAAAVAPGTRLFDADLEAVRNRVEAMPWVAHAKVTRQWPAQLAIQVWERRPLALWGEHGLVDEEGMVFTPPPRELPQNLPRLDGPASRAAQVLQDYQQLAAALAGSAFVPTGLRLDARGAWTFTTVAGVELRLGEDDPRSKVGTILGVVARALGDGLDHVSYVDLRYRNGFAVGWVSRDECPDGRWVSVNRSSAATVQGCLKETRIAPGTVPTNKVAGTAEDGKHE